MALEADMNGKLNGVNDRIVSLFDCPVCLETMASPIYQCKKSHHICGPCKSKIQNCPSCSDDILNERSVFAEQIAEYLHFPCKNAEAGCIEKFPQKELANHHSICLYRQYDCVPGCQWKGRSYEILVHMMECHRDLSWMEAESNMYYENNIFDQLKDMQIISACQEIFWYHILCDASKQKLFLAVQYIGKKDLASNFTYEFLLTSESDIEKTLSIKQRTHPDIEEINTLYESERCIVLDYSLIRKYLNGDKDDKNCLVFNLKIAKVMPLDEGK
ncbi:hypothetical protein C0J52_07290 [Blattella germanica]|nr:hypothetical protein C0J52_07290 [Blattella germanica]